MKTLILIGALQVVMFAVLFGKLSAIDKRIEAAPQQEPVLANTDFALTSTDTIETSVPQVSISQDDRLFQLRMRRIVREELEAHFVNTQNSGPRESEESAGQRMDPLLSGHELDLIIQEISNYQSLGQISLKDIEDLQMEIVRLNDADRKVAFSSLAKAVNSGSLSVR